MRQLLYNPKRIYHHENTIIFKLTIRSSAGGAAFVMWPGRGSKKDPQLRDKQRYQDGN